MPTHMTAGKDGRKVITFEIRESKDGSFRWRPRRAGRTLNDNYTRRVDASRSISAFVRAIQDGDFVVKHKR